MSLKQIDHETITSETGYYVGEIALCEDSQHGKKTYLVVLTFDNAVKNFSFKAHPAAQKKYDFLKQQLILESKSNQKHNEMGIQQTITTLDKTKDNINMKNKKIAVLKSNASAKVKLAAYNKLENSLADRTAPEKELGDRMKNKGQDVIKKALEVAIAKKADPKVIEILKGKLEKNNVNNNALIKKIVRSNSSDVVKKKAIKKVLSNESAMEKRWSKGER